MAITMTEIGRSKLPKLSSNGGTDEIGALAGDLRREALATLGLEAEDEPQVQDPRSPLVKALADLEIEVLDWREVLLYKLEQRHKHEMARLKAESTGENPPVRLPSFTWERTAIKKYKGRIPDHVLLKAAQIKRACPEVRFYVDHLEETRDPFLVATLHELTSWDWQTHPHFYVEVWEEPDFERRF